MAVTSQNLSYLRLKLSINILVQFSRSSGDNGSVMTSLDLLATELIFADERLYADRQEWKFVLPPCLAEALRREVMGRMAHEEFVPGRKVTAIHSIYFDSDDWQLYRRSLDNQLDRMKVRVRSYETLGGNWQADSQCFVECKFSRKGKKKKVRFQFPRARVIELFDIMKVQRFGTGLLHHEPELKGWRKVMRVLREYQLSPRVTVSYAREAFVSEDGELRVTFDQQYQASAFLAHNAAPLVKPIELLDTTILEIKFVGLPPAWLNRLLDQYGLPLGGHTFSKYKTAVDRLFSNEVSHVATA